MTTPAPPKKGARLGGKGALDDLVMLDKISEEAIVETLKNRYAQDLIYTNIGPVLVAINPFKMIQSLYTDARIREYKGKKFFELPPHVYALADETYSNMISYRENQCVIISGESGSGKTETSKIIMQYISGVSGKSKEVVRVKERMLSSNPVLEGFGNAKTVNNNNSSRFGKYMEVLFDFAGDPVGGRVTNYLLEKSRVVGPAVGERNFHAFYQICKGASAQDREQYCIEGVEYYYYLSQTECYDVPGIDDVSDYKELVQALDTVGLTAPEIGEVHRVVSAILWLGNVAFTEDNQEKSSVQDPQVLEMVGHLLQIEIGVLTKALCERTLQSGVGARAEVYNKPNNALQADFCRDTLAKALYSRLFDWLVRKVNESIRKEDFEGVHIGILDIYGFEIFDSNSFEQLCINFVNEKLQQIFIELTLKAEQEEYVNEGIPWKDIKYYNNKPLCDLIEGTPGVLSVCDDCCNTSKSDSMYMQDLTAQFGSLPIIHVGTNDFTIRHYAGDVRYESNGFLTKNKDTLFDDLVIALQSSPCQFVKDQGWADIKITAGQKKQPITVGKQFRGQVNSLISALKACVPHYIRCIKPNHEKTPNNFNVKNTRRQVQYLGLLENVRVRRAGYAYRSPFARFVKRYTLLDKDLWSGKIKGGPKEQCQHLVRHLGWGDNKEYAIGKTKIFIQDAATLFLLEDLLDRRLTEAVVLVQKAYRRYKQKRYYLQTRADCYDLVKGKKGRRRGSVDREYRGDYLDFSYNKLVNGLLSNYGDKEKILFADRSKLAILRGQAGLFGRMKSAIVGSDKKLSEHRFVLLSDKALYSFAFEVEEKKGDPTPGKTKVKLFFRVPTLQIQSITISSMADNWLVFHFAPVANVRDVLLSCRRKTELLGLLVTSSKQQNKPLLPDWKNMDTIVVNAKKKKSVDIKWVEDESVDPNTDRIVKAQNGKCVEVHVPSGVPATAIKEPFRPTAYDSGSRPSLKALYECKGNGIDELGFNAGDILFIIKDVVDGWYEAELNGQTGFVPETYVERIGPKRTTTTATKKPATTSKKNKWQELKTDEGETYYYNPDTDQSVWDKPSDFDSAPEPTSAPSSGPKKALPTPTPGSTTTTTSTVSKPALRGSTTTPPTTTTTTTAPPTKPKIGAIVGGRPASGSTTASKTDVPKVTGKVGAATGVAAIKFGQGPPKIGGGSATTSAPPTTAPPTTAPPTTAPPTTAPTTTPSTGVSGGPAGFKLPALGGGRGVGLGGTGGGTGGLKPVAKATPAPSVPAPKKSDWVKLKDDASGDFYYYNEKTNESSWDPPPGFTG